MTMSALPALEAVAIADRGAGAAAWSLYYYFAAEAEPD